MKKYQVVVRYPQHMNPEDAQQFDHLDALDVESKFDSIQWQQQLLRQLQLESHDTTFIVKDSETQQALNLYLKAYATAGEITFKLDSNIEVEKSHKDLFGLLTIKSKDHVTFQNIAISQVREYLSQFLCGYVVPMQEDYKISLEKTSKA
jgi:hypothetical protein